ncbi:MAG: ferrous iron transport protein A [Saprospiraceae bacterium]
MVATLASNKQLSQMKPGTSGFVAQFTNEQLGCKLLAMGVFPGSQVQIVRKAPFGGSLFLKVDNNYLALRQQEAACILLR